MILGGAKIWYDDYTRGSVTDPTCSPSVSFRVGRGGSWNAPAEYCRSAYRYRFKPSDRDDYSGFCVCQSLSGK